MKGTDKYKWKRTGYSKDGIPARLDLVKTLKQSLARRIATKKKCSECDGEGCQKCDGTGTKKARYLDNVDLRYKHFTKQPYPIRQAVMICLMDVSASMGEFEKTLAKKFFLLLYLFLNKCYTQVEVLFISHTTDAQEVTEEEFFYGTRTGGTIVSAGLKLANDIIDNRIDLNTTNVYVSQASDGDNWPTDTEATIQEATELLQKVQYFAYIQVETLQRRIAKEGSYLPDLVDIYNTISNEKLQTRMVNTDEDVYPVLRSLFENEN